MVSNTEEALGTSLLPSPVAANHILQKLSHHCVIASAGLEGSTVGNGRAKIYFRLQNAVALDALGVGILAAPDMIEFLAIAMGAYEVDLEGLVMSIGFSLSTGKLVDAKIDLCGHCLRHAPKEWSAIVHQLTQRFSLPPLNVYPNLESGEYQVAFIGLGLTTDHQPRLNFYIKYGVPVGIPQADEIGCSLVDAISYLESIQNQDGSWHDYRLPVGASDQWVTAYAAHALAQCGKILTNGNATETALQAAKWLSENRTYQAGWGYNGSTGPDSDSTAMAIALFDELSLPVSTQDRLFLSEHWRDSNGVATYDGPDAWGVGHWDVTPWAYHGMGSDDRERYREKFLQALKNNRMDNGFWRSYWWRNPFYCTLVTLEVLARLAIPEPQIASAEPMTPVPIDNPFDLACYVGIEHLRNPFDSRIAGHLRVLLNWQESDGRWRRSANLRVTEPHCYEPWVHSEGVYYEDSKSLFTTATVIRVLCRQLVVSTLNSSLCSKE